MKTKTHNYYVTSANFNGQGRGFAIGFDDYKAAQVFAGILLFGFAEVLTWYEYDKRFGNIDKP